MSEFDTLPTSPDQARTFLTAAEARDCWPTGYSGNLNYSDAFHALRDAQVGTGHATLVVSQELTKLREGLADVGDIVPLRQDLAAIAWAAPTGTGAYALDKSFHIGFLFLTALVIAGGM